MSEPCVNYISTIIKFWLSSGFSVSLLLVKANFYTMMTLKQVLRRSPPGKKLRPLGNSHVSKLSRSGSSCPSGAFS